MGRPFVLGLLLLTAGPALAQDNAEVAPDDFIDEPATAAPEDPAGDPPPNDGQDRAADPAETDDKDRADDARDKGEDPDSQRDEIDRDDEYREPAPDPSYDADYDAGFDLADGELGFGKMLPWMGVGCAATAVAGCVLAWIPAFSFAGAGVLSVIATVVTAIIAAVMGTNPKPEGEVSEAFEDGYADGGKNGWLYNLFGSLIGSAISHVALIGVATLSTVSIAFLYVGFYAAVLAIVFGGALGGLAGPGPAAIPSIPLGRLTGAMMPLGFAGPRE